ncbi:MAG: NAD(P)-dependent oxidoreductase [Chitinophagaceae bacterium]|nr:NAD(P)-dependent oxidoreductase [Chitinophagaceae bacterium]
MKEKILITGASGFLGFHLIDAALKRGLDVYAGVRKTSEITHLSQFPVKLVDLNLSDLNQLTKELTDKKFSYIIHAAGITRAKTAAQYNVVNADFTINLAKAALHEGTSLKNFVFVSSLAAAGPIDNLKGIITESSSPNPVTSYGRSKLLAETRLQELSLPSVILRPTAIYGPREKDIFMFVKSISRGIEPYIGSGDQQLSFIYAKDMAEVAMSALESSDIGPFNISDGNSYSRYDMANYLKHLMKRKTLKFHVPSNAVRIFAKISEEFEQLFNKTPVLNEEKLKELTAKNWTCSIDKARRELNFNPSFDLEKGLAETLQWYNQSNWL